MSSAEEVWPGTGPEWARSRPWPALQPAALRSTAWSRPRPASPEGAGVPRSSLARAADLVRKAD